jgi:uncharacterized protein (DUF1330 family)
MKAYFISETEALDSAALAEFVPRYLAALKRAGGRAFQTANGRIVGLEGSPPVRVVISEWDGLEQAQAFRRSSEFESLVPLRDRAIKIIRSYIVETAAE